jgi:hypothetical protein
MGSLFSKSHEHDSNKKKQKNVDKPPAVTSKDRAVLDLKNAKDRLKKFKKKVG